MPSDVSIFAALGGGLLSFLSPCVLPLIPAYFGSMTGPAVFEHTDRKVRLPVFLHSVMFVLGFTVIFVGLGALAGLLGFNLASQILVKKIAGGLLIAFGVFMLLALKIPWLNFEKRLALSGKGNSGYLRSILIGGIFAFAWTPCAGPILGGVLALALDTATAWQGAFLLAVYSLGLGLPFLALGIGFDFLMPYLKQLHKHTSKVYAVSGILLIITGVLILTNWVF